MAGHSPSRLKPRHHEIIRLAFAGMKHVEIAAQIGMSPAAVSCVLRCDAAKHELARLQVKSEDKLCDIPSRIALQREVDGFGVEALRFSRNLVKDTTVDVRVRQRTAQHALDRTIFRKEAEEEDKRSFKDVLRGLDKLADHIRTSKLQLPGEGEVLETTAIVEEIAS